MKILVLLASAVFVGFHHHHHLLLLFLLLAHLDIALALSSSSSSSSSSCSSSSSRTTTATATSKLGTSSSSNVHVYNNVLPTESCDALHHAASQQVGLEHKVFQRGLPSSDLIIEQALESILNELQSTEEEEEEEGEEGEEGGDSDSEDEQQQQQYVEYWTRQEWRHIEAHADVDENLAKQHDIDFLGTMIDDDDKKSYYFRYPDFGHVLYLKIGSKVRGPTCVFPNIKSGGDLLSSSSTSSAVDLITVPAVDGRLLRFDGTALHAVPRPADIWFLSFVKGSAQYTPEEEYGRSVILFNVWSNEPPKDVPISSSSSSSSSCASTTTSSSDDDDDDGITNNEEEEEEGSTTKFVNVNPQDTWEKVFDFINDDDEDHEEEEENEFEGSNTDDGGDEDDSTTIMYSKVKIWLLGNERRRQYPMRTIQMKGQSEIKEIFQESKQVHHVQLERWST